MQEKEGKRGMRKIADHETSGRGRRRRRCVVEEEEERVRQVTRGEKTLGSTCQPALGTFRSGKSVLELEAIQDSHRHEILIG